MSNRSTKVRLEFEESSPLANSISWDEKTQSYKARDKTIKTMVGVADRKTAQLGIWRKAAAFYCQHK
jgi:hypothetical protein